MNARSGHSRNEPEIVGKLTAPHGVRGWLKVFSYTRPPARILEFDHWLVGEGPANSAWQTTRPLEFREQGRKILVRLAGVNDRDDADTLVGKWVAVERSALGELPEDEFYWSDLVGLTVTTADGALLGKVDHLLETGANDVMVVKQVSGDSERPRERLIPWTGEVVSRVDVDGGNIVVDWDPDF